MANNKPSREERLGQLRAWARPPHRTIDVVPGVVSQKPPGSGVALLPSAGLRLLGFSRMQKVVLQPFTVVVTRPLERPFHRVPAMLLAGQTCCASFGVAHGPIPRYHQESATSLTR